MVLLLFDRFPIKNWIIWQHQSEALFDDSVLSFESLSNEAIKEIVLITSLSADQVDELKKAFARKGGRITNDA